MFPQYNVLPQIMLPKGSLSFKFFNEIQDKQSKLDERLPELETRLASKDNSKVSEMTNPGTVNLAQT